MDSWSAAATASDAERRPPTLNAGRTTTAPARGRGSTLATVSSGTACTTAAQLWPRSASKTMGAPRACGFRYAPYPPAPSRGATCPPGTGLATWLGLHSQPGLGPSLGPGRAPTRTLPEPGSDPSPGPGPGPGLGPGPGPSLGPGPWSAAAAASDAERRPPTLNPGRTITAPARGRGSALATVSSGSACTTWLPASKTMGAPPARGFWYAPYPPAPSRGATCPPRTGLATLLGLHSQPELGHSLGPGPGPGLAPTRPLPEPGSNLGPGQGPGLGPGPGPTRPRPGPARTRSRPRPLPRRPPAVPCWWCGDPNDELYVASLLTLTAEWKRCQEIAETELQPGEFTFCGRRCATAAFKSMTSDELHFA